MKGKDIVCAAVSALCIALKSSVTGLSEKEKKFFYKYSASDGRLFLEASHFSDEKTYLRINDLFLMFYNGMKEIQRLYPANVKLRTE